MKPTVKRATLILTILTIGLSLLNFLPAVVVNADIDAKETSKQSDYSTTLNESIIKKADQYIYVSDNQYRLRSSDDLKLDSDQISLINKTLEKSNENIIAQKLIIDPETKIAFPSGQGQRLLSRAAYNKNYTYKNFWWGTRYYFTSNAAVEQLAHNFNQKANILTAGGILGGVVSVGSVVAIAGATAWFFNKMASDLRYYNSTHVHNQIYMDLNMSLSYSFHILK